MEANTPLPKSSAGCPAEPAVTSTDKGLIAVGVVLAVILVAAALYAAYRWLTKKRVNSTHLPSPEPRMIDIRVPTENLDISRL